MWQKSARCRFLLPYLMHFAGQYTRRAENKKSQQQHLQSCAFEKNEITLSFFSFCLSGESIGKRKTRTSRTCKKQPRQTLSEVQSIMVKPAWKGYWKRLTFLVKKTSEVHKNHLEESLLGQKNTCLQGQKRNTKAGRLLSNTLEVCFCQFLAFQKTKGWSLVFLLQLLLP